MFNIVIFSNSKKEILAEQKYLLMHPFKRKELRQTNGFFVFHVIREIINLHEKHLAKAQYQQQQKFDWFFLFGNRLSPLLTLRIELYYLQLMSSTLCSKLKWWCVWSCGCASWCEINPSMRLIESKRRTEYKIIRNSIIQNKQSRIGNY